MQFKMLQYELEMYHDVEVMADLPVNTIIDITGIYPFQTQLWLRFCNHVMKFFIAGNTFMLILYKVSISL